MQRKKIPLTFSLLKQLQDIKIGGCLCICVKKKLNMRNDKMLQILLSH